MSEEWRRNVLLVGFAETAMRRVGKALATCRPRVTVARGGNEALSFATNLHYDALLVSHPLPDAPLEPLLDAVRTPSSPCRRAGLVLVTDEHGREAAESYLGRGANRVVDVEEAPDRLQGELDLLFRIQPRLPARLPCRLRVAGRKLERRIFCETVNLSVSGMLLRVPNSYAAGTELELDVYLPGQRDPVQCAAGVVRQTRQGREVYPGVGLTLLARDPALTEWMLRRLEPRQA